MDNTQQTIQPNQQNTIVEFPKTTGTSPVSSQPQQPSGKQHKELEPMPSLSSTSTEVLQPVDQHIELEPEVAEAGVAVVAPAPHISQQAKQAGVELVKEALPIEKEPEPKFMTSLTLAKAQQVIKGKFIFKDASKPILWLALLLIRQHQILEQQENNKKGIAYAA